MTLFVAAVVAATISPFAPQPLIIGPFKLGDLILSNSDSGWFVKQLKDGGLDVDEVKKQMNEWKISLVDYKVRKPDGKWKWHRPEKGGWPPKVVVEGRMSFELKDRKGNKVEIALTEADAGGTSSNQDDSPATVRCPISITLRFHGLQIGEPGGILHWPKEAGTKIPAILYDVSGRASIEKPQPKK